MYVCMYVCMYIYIYIYIHTYIHTYMYIRAASERSSSGRFHMIQLYDNLIVDSCISEKQAISLYMGVLCYKHGL